MFVADSDPAAQAETDHRSGEGTQARPRIQLIAMISDARRMLQLINAAAPGAVRRVAIAAVLEAVAITCLPYTTRGLIDAIATAHHSSVGPLGWLAAEASLIAVRLVATALLRHSALIIQFRGTPYLKARVMEKGCNIAYSHFESPAFLNRITRAREDAVLYGCTYALNAVMVGRTALSFLGCMILLLWVGPVWTVPLLVVAAIPSFLFDIARARRLFELEGMSMDRNRQAWYIEWLLGTAEPIKDIRAFGIGRWLVALHNRINLPFQDSRVALAHRHFKGYLALMVLSAVVPYVPFGYLLIGTVHGESTLGQLLFFFLAFNQCSTALSQMLLAFSTAFEHHLYVHNLVEILDFPATDPDVEPQMDHVLPAAPALTIENLWFSYPGSAHPIFRGLNLHVREGEILAIVGRNGIGKTTLVKILLGIHAGDRGKISLGGIDIATRSIAWRRANIGILMQDFVRYQFTVSDGVGIGWIPCVADSEMIAKALQSAEAGEIVSRLPQGKDTPLGPAFGGQDLSGGQWQRMALARLFMRPSRLWILDEPTSAMDPKTEEQVFECFRQSAAGRTAIIITHRFSTARIADRIAVVDAGRVVEIGTHEELLGKRGYYAEIFNLQAKSYAAGVQISEPPERGNSTVTA